MRRQSRITAQQIDLFDEVHESRLCTDASLAAALTEAGHGSIDRSTIVRMRSGEIPAPLGLLPVLLRHVAGPPGPRQNLDAVAQVLDVYAAPFGLEVSARASREAERTLPQEILDVVRAATALLEGVEAGEPVAEVRERVRRLRNETTQACDAAVAEAK